MKRLEDTKVAIERTVDIIESQRLQIANFDSRAAYFAAVHQYYALYIQVLIDLDELHPNQGFSRQAFEASEKSKVRSLLDLLGRSTQNLPCGELLKKQLRPDFTGSERGNKNNERSVASTTSVLTLQRVQAEIPDRDTVLLEYALGQEKSHLWIVDHETISAHALPGEARISELATQFRNALMARQALPNESAEHYNERVTSADRALDASARKLSQVLLGPALDFLITKKRILIVADGPLRYIPFSALPIPSTNSEQGGRTLMAQYAVVNLPSASTLQALRDAAGRHKPPTEAAAVFADPVFSNDDPRVSQSNPAKVARFQAPPALGAAMRDTQFGSKRIPRLPESGKEADDIAQILPGSDVFLGFKASRETVLSTDLLRYRYIHFATHGILDSAHPEFSGLVLSLVDPNGSPEEGYLRMQDIYNLNLAADLVVLSSCNSALGKDLQSEGIIGLTRAFLYAGSQRVISTLWKVNDQATAQLMRLFYSHLHAGESPASALRSAQSDLAKDPQWRHPYYWAAFVLQGEYR